MVVAALAVPANAATISFSPSTRTAQPGDTFLIDVTASLFGSNGIGDYDLTVNFNPAVLSATGIAFGTSLGGPAQSIQSASISAGFAELSEVSLLSTAQLIALQTGTLRLATITFRALALGSSGLSFSGVQVDDANALPLSVTAGSGAVNVGVPEPSPALLLGILLPLLAFRRRLN